MNSPEGGPCVIEMSEWDEKQRATVGKILWEMGLITHNKQGLRLILLT